MAAVAYGQSVRERERLTPLTDRGYVVYVEVVRASPVAEQAAYLADAVIPFESGGADLRPSGGGIQIGHGASRHR